MRAWLIERVAGENKIIALALMAWLMSRKEQLQLLLMCAEFVKSRVRRDGKEYDLHGHLDSVPTRCLFYWMYQVLQKDTKKNRDVLFREMLHFKKVFYWFLPLEPKDNLPPKAESSLAGLLICAGAVAKRLAVGDALIELHKSYDYILEDGLKILKREKLRKEVAFWSNQCIAENSEIKE